MKIPHLRMCPRCDWVFLDSRQCIPQYKYCPKCGCGTFRSKYTYWHVKNIFKFIKECFVSGLNHKLTK